MRSTWKDLMESPLVKAMLNEAGRRGLLTREEERVLILAAQQGDQRAREQLAICNSPFVVTQVKRMTGWGMDYADLFQEGMIGLDAAIDKYDTERFRIKFISYAVWWIRQAMMIAAQNQAGAMRVPVNGHSNLMKIRRMLHAGKRVDVYDVRKMFNVTRPVAEALLEQAIPAMSTNAVTKRSLYDGDDLELGDSLAAPFNDDVADEDEGRWAVALIEADHKMTPRQKHVVVQRIFHGRTLDDIASDYGVSRERIRQVEKEAMVRVRRIAAEYDERCGFTKHDRRQMLSMGG